MDLDGGMRVLKVMIIDDEILGIALLRMYIGRFDQLELIGEYTDAREALDAVKTKQPDAIFLDIEMPHMNGIEFANQLNAFNDSIQIVFVTAYKNYALSAFNVNAVHYLLKPISEADMIFTINRLFKNQTLKKQAQPENVEFSIEVFGGFKVYGSHEDNVVQWPTKKVKEIFSYFVCHRNKELDKWRLCEILWPESNRDKAEHNLHSTISRLKQALKDVGLENILSRNKSTYSCNLDQFSCELWEFDDFLLKNPLIDKNNVYQYEAILERTGDELFAQDDYIWAREFQENWNERHISCLRNLIDYFSTNGFSNKVETYAKMLLDKDPYDEQTIYLLMNEYGQKGKQKEVIQLFQQYASLLKEELNLEPSRAMIEHLEKLLNK
jgi:two-component SAPR family response regulator